MTAHTTLAIGAYAGARIALLVTNLLGDEKGRYYGESASAIITKALDVASYPDTVVYVFDTDNEGEMRGTANARIQRDGVGPVRYHIM